MNCKIIKSYAKINLSLGVIGKLKSGYHKIESLVSFVNLYDEIKIKKISQIISYEKDSNEALSYIENKFEYY